MQLEEMLEIVKNLRERIENVPKSLRQEDYELAYMDADRAVRLLIAVRDQIMWTWVEQQRRKTVAVSRAYRKEVMIRDITED